MHEGSQSSRASLPAEKPTTSNHSRRTAVIGSASAPSPPAATSQPARRKNSATIDSPKLCCSPGALTSRTRRPLGGWATSVPKAGLNSLIIRCRRPRPIVTSVKKHRSSVQRWPSWRAAGASRSTSRCSTVKPRRRSDSSVDSSAASSPPSSEPVKASISAWDTRPACASLLARVLSSMRCAATRRGMTSVSMARARQAARVSGVGSGAANKAPAASLPLTHRAISSAQSGEAEPVCDPPCILSSCRVRVVGRLIEGVGGAGSGIASASPMLGSSRCSLSASCLPCEGRWLSRTCTPAS